MKQPASNIPALADARLGPFNDPLKGWPNDDILLSQGARDDVAAYHPEALEVLDWPELRTFFALHDKPAGEHGRKDRHFGLLSVICGSSGLVFAAFVPLAAGFEWLIGLAAITLTLVGALLAAVHWLGAQSKSRWLGHRYFTERARGLYFQILVNNLELAARAMREPSALEHWKVLREDSLRRLSSAGDLPSIVRRLTGDLAEDEPWVNPAWRKAMGSLPRASKELNVLLDFIREQRFGIQLAYTEKKLGDSFVAPRIGSQANRLASDGLSLGAVISAAVAGAFLLADGSPNDFNVKLCLALAATASAIVLALRAINDGLGLEGDASRYEWYYATVSRARARFDAGDIAEKVEALRMMEVLAYRELRAFLTDHWRARFIM